MRCINIVNFIRAVEPRFETDLLLPVQKQMDLIVRYDFPATWLLQFDALVSGPFVDYLKKRMRPNHEVGFWFEMNEMHCRAAGVPWRGRPGYEWDHLPFVAFTIGYTKEERVRLADTAMTEFKKIWGHYPKSVASWNLDAFTIGHLVDHYGVDAFAVCRDQIATDGFTIWGAPIAGYYPSRQNCWSPAVDKRNQIDAPIFRMLGQDPVYYYDRVWKMKDGKEVSFPDTMEPVWPSGRDPWFVRSFLEMIEDSDCMRFAYLQMGQENSFPWHQQAEGYPRQMEKLAEVRERGKVVIETLGDTGRRFKKAFKTTPQQAQVQAQDPYGKQVGDQRSIWYQNRFYRANLHMKENKAYFRDLVVYSDAFPQPFLNEATKDSFVEQRLPAIMDGYHWSREPGSLAARSAGAYLQIGGRDVELTGPGGAVEKDGELVAMLQVEGGAFLVRFAERTIAISLRDLEKPFQVSFEWDPGKSAFQSLDGSRANFKFGDFSYHLVVVEGHIRKTDSGFIVESEAGKIVLQLN